MFCAYRLNLLVILGSRMNHLPPVLWSAFRFMIWITVGMYVWYCGEEYNGDSFAFIHFHLSNEFDSETTFYT